MYQIYTFKEFLYRRWWVFLLVLVKGSNTFGPGSPIFIGGAILGIMYTYWFIKYGRKQRIEKKRLVAVVIKFYSEDEASVECETKFLDEKEYNLMLFFMFYYAKMLYCLGLGEHSTSLILYIQKTVETVLLNGRINRTNILATGQNLVEPRKNNVTKKYSGELYEVTKRHPHEIYEGMNRTVNIETHMTAKGEGYYAPVSVVMLLQYIVTNLSDNSLKRTMLALRRMTKYYLSIGDCSAMQSLIDAPYYGLRMEKVKFR